MTTVQRHNRRRIFWGGILVGVGLGGFFDGIVLHQILQWHHMVSDIYPTTTVVGIKINTLGDGFFHAATYILTVTGLVLLWSVARRSHGVWPVSLLVSLLFIGWGIFNIVEGIFAHHIFQVHHVRNGSNQLTYDLIFLAWGSIMLIGGWLGVRHSLRHVVDTATAEST